GLLPEQREYSLSELVDQKNLEVIKYNTGVTKYIPSTDTGGIMATIIPRPHSDVDDPNWKPVDQGMVKTIETLSPLCVFNQDPDANRWGFINALSFGISFRNGHQ
ncbi:hypothetical protein V5O48_014236, partial [Marasmius crinis-equi]